MRTGQKLSPTGRINLIDTRQVEERFQQRGRGAISNQTGRFELETRQAFDDGWGTIEDDDSRMETLLMKDSARTIITFNNNICIAESNHMLLSTFSTLFTGINFLSTNDIPTQFFHIFNHPKGRNMGIML